MDDYLSKPIDVDALMHSLANAGRRRAERTTWQPPPQAPPPDAGTGG